MIRFLVYKTFNLTILNNIKKTCGCISVCVRACVCKNELTFMRALNLGPFRTPATSLASVILNFLFKKSLELSFSFTVFLMNCVPIPWRMCISGKIIFFTEMRGVLRRFFTPTVWSFLGGQLLSPKRRN